MPGQRRDQHGRPIASGRRSRTTQVRGEVAGGPARAQRRRVRPHLEQQIGELRRVPAGVVTHAVIVSVARPLCRWTHLNGCERRRPVRQDGPVRPDTPADTYGRAEILTTRASRDVLGRGLRVLGTAIRTEPRLFAIGAVGSSLFGLLVIANAYVVGAVIGHVVVPAFAEGRAGAGRAGADRGGRSSASALLRVGDHLRPPPRRRLHAVPAAGPLPPRGHPPLPGPAAVLAPAARHRHAAVQRQLRRRGRVRADRAAAVRGRHDRDDRRPRWSRCSSPTGCSRWSASRSSRRCSASTWSTPGGCRPGRSAPSSCAAEVSAIAHESFDGALVVKTMGREADETAPLRRSASAELRDALISVGRLRGLFDPLMDALPSVGTLAVLLLGALAAADRRDQRRRAGQRRLPVHRAGLPGARDRLGARRAAAQRGRLGAGRRRCSAPTGDLRLRRRRPPTARPARRRSRFDDVDFRYADGPPVLHDVTLHRPGRPDRRAGRRRPAPASRRSPRWPSGWSTRRAAGSPLDGVDAARR